MKEKKIALLLDVDNVKIGADAFDELYQKLLNMGDVVYCKFYGYNDRKHIYLSEVISQYGYETAPFMRFKKRFSQLDTRIIVDAVRLCYTKPEIDTYCIVAGEGDLIPLLVELKSSGKTVVDVNTEYQEMNTHMFDEHITLTKINSSNDAYSSKAKKVITTKTKTTKTKSTTPSKVTTTTTTKTYTKQAPAKEDYYEETVYDNDQLSDMLKDITDRYSELDFSDNSDIDKKVELIKDIEVLIDDETKKGEGLNSKNADIRQIFVELQNIVDDMKNAL
ncbi:MAG: NYN domain-containing protein [Firmicutes bacterium]|nr:NYN domain-containing protein [Bacillota bacterium]MDY5676617.1 NYN domain-containing protein [Eubacteriales bacterium]